MKKQPFEEVLEEGYRESNEENVKVAEEMEKYIEEIIEDNEPWQKALEWLKEKLKKNNLITIGVDIEKSLKICQKETEKKFIEKCNKSKIWDNLGFIKGTKLYDYVKNLEKTIGELEGEKELSEFEHIMKTADRVNKKWEKKIRDRIEWLDGKIYPDWQGLSEFEDGWNACMEYVKKELQNLLRDDG